MNIEQRQFCDLMPNAISRQLLGDFFALDWNAPAVRGDTMNHWAQGSHLGSKRPRNEDRALTAVVTTQAKRAYGLAVVCDGVGGSKSGDLAANIALATIVGELACLKRPQPIEQLLDTLVRSADEVVRNTLRGNGATTLSVLIASSNGEIAATNIGDSRLYSWAPPGKGLLQISVDDTVENELKGLALKDMSAIAARGLAGSLTQAIGEVGRSKDDLQIKIFGRAHFPNGFIIGTDGLWKVLPLGFELIVSNAANSLEIVRKLLQFALWVGGIDNASLVAFENVETLVVLAANAERAESEICWATIWACESTLSYAFPQDTSTPNRNQREVLTEPVKKVVKSPKKGGTKKRTVTPRREGDQILGNVNKRPSEFLSNQLQIDIPDDSE